MSCTPGLSELIGAPIPAVDTVTSSNITFSSTAPLSDLNPQISSVSFDLSPDEITMRIVMPEPDDFDELALDDMDDFNPTHPFKRRIKEIAEESLPELPEDAFMGISVFLSKDGMSSEYPLEVTVLYQSDVLYSYYDVNDVRNSFANVLRHLEFPWNALMAQKLALVYAAMEDLDWAAMGAAPAAARFR